MNINIDDDVLYDYKSIKNIYKGVELHTHYSGIVKYKNLIKEIFKWNNFYFDTNKNELIYKKNKYHENDKKKINEIYLKNSKDFFFFRKFVLWSD